MTGIYQFDFTEGSIRPGIELSLLIGAGREKLDTKEEYYGGGRYLGVGAGASFFIKGSLSERFSITARLGGRLKTVSFIEPDLSKNSWKLNFGMEARYLIR